MQLNAFGAALLRRWYLVVVSLGLAVAASAYVVSDVGPTYEVEGTVLLFPPTSSTTSGDQTVTQGNPYLYLGGLNPARDILIRSLTSRGERDALAQLHPDADYTMESDISTSGPLMVLNVSSGSSAEAVAALNTLLDKVPAALDTLQADLGIDSDAYITSQTLTADDRPEVIHKGQIRAAIVSGAGVLALCLLLVGLADGLLLSAAARAGAGRQDESDVSDDPVDTADTAETADNPPPDGEVLESHPPEDTDDADDADDGDDGDDVASPDEPQAGTATVPPSPASRPTPRKPATNGTGPVPGRRPPPTTPQAKAAKKPRKQKPRPRSRGNLSSVG